MSYTDVHLFIPKPAPDAPPIDDGSRAMINMYRGYHLQVALSYTSASIQLGFLILAIAGVHLVSTAFLWSGYTPITKLLNAALNIFVVCFCARVIRDLRRLFMRKAELDKELIETRTVH